MAAAESMGGRWAGLRRQGAAGALAVLFVAGLVHWGWFFSNPRGAGLAACTGSDWSLGIVYHDAIREALATRTMPYVMRYDGHFSDRFLGLPETPLAPQYLLLPWLGDAVFNLVNVLLLYACAFAGLLMLRRELGWGLPAFAFYWLLFSFNGYLVSRVSAGHFMWFGYFLLPWLQLALVRLLRDPGVRHGELFIGFVLFGILLHGSFHLTVWLLIYLALAAAMAPRAALPLGRGALWGLALSAFRLLPSALTLWDTRYKVVAGYGGLPQFFEALTQLHGMRHTDLERFGDLMWWEVDAYIGVAGALLLAYFGVVRALPGPAADAPPRDAALRAVDAAALLMLPLCFGTLMNALGELPLPFFRSQRIPTRMVIVPLVMASMMAAHRMDAWLRQRPGEWLPRAAVAGLLALLALELYLHSSAWRVFYMDEWFGDALLHVAPPGPALYAPDPAAPGIPAYLLALRTGLILSAAAAAAAFLHYRRAPAPK